MSQSIITNAFSAWIAERLAENKPGRPDKMVFAYIDGQDEKAAIDLDEPLPDESQIVYSCDVTQFGTINENAFVCSVVLDTTIGDWRYNWIGLVDSESDTLVMIVHTAEQQKIKTAGGAQGNSLTRNLMMEFSGAAAASQITVTAETWQIDYSARLRSMDEAGRLALVDYYGAAAFRDDGFMVSLADGVAEIAPGLGYVSGLRVSLPEGRTAIVGGSVGIWVDAVWSGTVTGYWQHSFDVVAADELSDYVDDAGFQHYVTRIASVSGGVVEDLRQPFPLQKVIADFDGEFLRIEANLSDVSDKSKARENLGLKGAAVLDVGTGAGTVAAGNDSRITGALQKEQNLSDVSDKTKARENLGLKGAAVLDVGTGAGTVAAGNDSRIIGALQSEKLLSEIAAKGAAAQSTARTNLGINDVGSIPGAGEIGSHLFARWHGGGALGRVKMRYGDTVAGSVLASTGLVDSSTSEATLRLSFYSNNTFANDVSGTWRCLGQMASDTVTGTLFVRIA